MVLLLEGRDRALLAVDATLELVRTEFVFFAMFLTSFRVKTRQVEKADGEEEKGMVDSNIITRYGNKYKVKTQHNV